jgi:hypothetical protein
MSFNRLGFSVDEKDKLDHRPRHYLYLLDFVSLRISNEKKTQWLDLCNSLRLSYASDHSMHYGAY